MHGELEILDVIPRKEGLELLGAAYSGMSDVIKGTQFDPAIPQDARIAENFLKPVNLLGRAIRIIRAWVVCTRSSA